MTTDTRHLRSLYAAATQGKWAADHDWDESAEVVEYVHLDTGTPGHKALFDTSNGDHRLVEAEYDENGVTFRDSTGRANMELVAAMHESLPTLLDEVEAARSLPNAGPRIANMRAAMASASERIAKILDSSRNGAWASIGPAAEDALAAIQSGLELALTDDAERV